MLTAISTGFFEQKRDPIYSADGGHGAVYDLVGGELDAETRFKAGGG